MPIGDILRFFAARAFPAALAFFALVIFTRLLTPAQFGEYSVTLSSVNVATAAVFYWLALSAVRFGIDGEQHRERYLGAILLLYLTCIVLTILGFGVFALVSNATVSSVLLIAAGLIVTESWFQLNQKLAIARVQARRFAMMGSIKVSVGLAVGSVAAFLGFGANGVLTGLIVGSLCAGCAPALYREWRSIELRRVSREHLSQVLRYGGPLGATIALGYATGTVDRLLLSVYHGTATAGQYAAAYDLAYATLTLALTTVNMVVYPHLLNAAHASSTVDRRSSFKGSLDLLLVVALPVLIALVAFAPNVTSLVLGAQFSEPAARVVPWIACATFIGGMRSYYLDVAFHLARDTRAILFVVAVVVSVNLLLNLLLIEKWAMQGALAAAITAQFVGFLMSAALGYRTATRAPSGDRETLKILFAGCVTGLVAWAIADFRGTKWLCAQLALLSVTYCVALASVRARVFVELLGLIARRLRAPSSWVRVP